MNPCVYSARLAAAAGTGEHAGLKEEGKKDVITGRIYSHKPGGDFFFSPKLLFL